MLATAVGAGEFCDATRVWAARQGIPLSQLEPTCLPAEGAPSRPDIFLLNAVTAEMLVDYAEIQK